MTCIPALSVLARLQTSAKTIRPSLMNGRARVLKTGALIDFGSIWMKPKLGGCAQHLNQLWKQTHLSALINLTQFGSLWIQRLPGGLGPVPHAGWMLQWGTTPLQHFTQCNWVCRSTRVHLSGGCFSYLRISGHVVKWHHTPISLLRAQILKVVISGSLHFSGHHRGAHVCTCTHGSVYVERTYTEPPDLYLLTAPSCSNCQLLRIHQHPTESVADGISVKSDKEKRDTLCQIQQVLRTELVLMHLWKSFRAKPWGENLSC